VGNHVSDRDFAESKDGVFDLSKVEAVDGPQKLFFEFLVQCVSAGEFFNCGFVDADVFCNFKLRGPSCWGSGGIARVCRQCKRNAAGECEIGSIRHDQAQMTMAAATADGWNGASIGKNFAGKDLDGGVCWRTDHFG